MQILKTSSLASGVVLAAWSSLAIAQSPAPAPPSAPTGDAMAATPLDAQQLPAISGTLERLTLTPRGDIDGFILKDDTEVKTAPDLGTQIAFVLRPGDRVTVHGLKAAAIPLMRAVSITDENSHRTITDSSASPDAPPPRRPAPPPPTVGATRETSGTVRMALHGPQGEVNGALLDNGAILRFPPDPTGRSPSIQPHQVLVAQGIAVTNPLGTVIDVQQIGTSREQLRPVGPPPRPLDDHPPAGGREQRPGPPPGPNALPPPPPAAGIPSPAALPAPPSA